MKKLLLLLALVVSPAVAENPPKGIKPTQVMMQLFCADSFGYLTEVLANEFRQVPVMMGYLKEGVDADTFVYFVNKDKTTSSIVITKRRGNKEESCVVWSGRSPSGMSLSMNPNPQFPEVL